MNNDNKKYIDQLSAEYLQGFGSELAKEAAEPVPIETAQAGANMSKPAGAPGKNGPALTKAQPGSAPQPGSATLRPEGHPRLGWRVWLRRLLEVIFRRH